MNVLLSTTLNWLELDIEIVNRRTGSAPVNRTSDIPQGSVLGPVSYTLSTTSTENIAHNSETFHHFTTVMLNLNDESQQNKYNTCKNMECRKSIRYFRKDL